jgi:glycosyltransferase involved in cell wall biosynthesis
MRIAMLAPFGIRPKGTLLVRMLPLAQALQRRGHEVTISAPPVHNPQDAASRASYAGVVVSHTPRPTLPGAAGVLQQVQSLLHSVLAQQPDMLHLFKPKGYSGLAALLARAVRPGLPLVVDTDDWEGRGGWNDLLPYPRAAKALFAWQERDLPRRAQAVTVASRTLQTQVWGAGVPPERVFYLPNGITTSSSPPARRPACTSHNPHGPGTLLLYTRFWEFDVRDLVAALVALVQAAPGVRLLVIGQGEQGEEQVLLRLAQRAGVRAALDCRGWVQPPDIPPLLALADIAIVPMDDTLINRARCSAKLLELLAAGLPVVAAQVGQVAEYIRHGSNGLLVPPGSPAALAQAACDLLADRPRQQQLAEQAQRSVAAFAWDRLVLTAEHAYQRASRG